MLKDEIVWYRPWWNPSMYIVRLRGHATEVELTREGYVITDPKLGNYSSVTIDEPWDVVVARVEAEILSRAEGPSVDIVGGAS